ncbi:MAG: DoxX family membrane protein [candidate division Zixibacteria bacterium]|nr:DoxX family membrane protein [candidate division Zixibacteria bacterium]
MRDFLKYIALILRVILGAAFIYASIDKIIHPAEFAKIIHYYRLLPGYLINFWAIVLPWIELAAGLFLVLGLYREGSLSIVTLLLVVFMIAIGINIIRGVNLQCGCFTVSPDAKADAWGTFVRDSWLLAAAIFVYLFDSASTGLDRFRLRNKTQG